MTKKAAEPKKSELDLRELAEQYGLSYNEINAIPELRALFQKAVAEGYNSTRFTAELKNTAWWRDTPDSTRKFFDLQYGDPATWNQKMVAGAMRASALAASMGFGDFLGGGQAPDNFWNFAWQLRDMAWMMNIHGWSEDRVKSWLGAQADFRSGVPIGGEAGRIYNQLHTLAYMNGRSYSDQWYTDQIRDVLGGKQTIERYESQIRMEAAADYKAFAQQILAGQNAMDLAAPYTRTVSTLLEKPDGSIGLNDPLLRRAMTTANKDGGAYSVWQLENDVRSDERWKQTNNARESVFKLAHNVLADFGVVT